MAFLRRLHGIELLDIPRCPRAIRDGALDYLQFVIGAGNAYAPVAEVLAASLKARGITSIVDVCSGGGGPWPELRARLVAAGAPAELVVTLTDRHPNVAAFDRNTACDERVTGSRVPVDVERDGVPLRGLRTTFSSFHHFEPATARRVIRNLGKTGDGILIAEVTDRGALAMAFMLMAPLLVWLATPGIRPFKWSRLFYTYVIPAIPFAVFFDGMMSCFRTYKPAELLALVTSVQDLQLEWQVGQLPARGRLPVTYALGLPKSSEVWQTGSDAPRASGRD